MRQVIGLTVVLSLSLVGSYVTWTDDGEVVDDTTAVVLAGTPKALQTLSWDGEMSTTTLSRESDEAGDYLWIESTVRTKKRKPVDPLADIDGEEDEEEAPEGGTDDAPEAGAPEEGADAPEDGTDDAPEEEEDAFEIETKVSHFRGNAQADELWENFAPLEALRELRADDETDRSAFGFDEPDAVVTITMDGKDHVLQVGGQTYGSKDRYVQSGDQVFLVDDATLRPLEFATSRLVERALFPSAAKETEAIEVRFPDGAIETFEQHNADDPAKAFWARPPIDDEAPVADETAGTWIDKLFRLRLREYLADDDIEGELIPVFSYVTRADGESHTIEILKVDNGDDKPEWYGRSSYNRSLVSLTASLASNVVDDLDSLRSE